jgi:hypothetical protein
MDGVLIVIIIANLISGAGNTLGKINLILGFTLQNKQPVI